MSLELITITQANVAWAVNENLRRIYAELEWKFPTSGRAILEGNLSFDDTYTITPVVAVEGGAEPVVIVADSFWNSVGYLAHFEGEVGATSFLDSKTGTSWSRTGDNALVSGGKFGFTAGGLTGISGGQWAITPLSSMQIGAVDFTVEAWVYPTAYPLDTTTDNTYSVIQGWAASSIQSYYYGITKTGAIFWWDSLDGSGAAGNVRMISAAGVVPLNTYTHTAVTRSGDVYRMFVNGVQVATFTRSGSFFTGSLGTPCTMGSITVPSFSYPLFGRIDEARLTKGVARYVANFTPPTTFFGEA